MKNSHYQSQQMKQSISKHKKKKQLQRNPTERVERFMENLYRTILEDVPTPPPTSSAEFAPIETPQNISLDQAVDRYLVRYERESIPTNNVYESLDRLLEQLDEEEPEEEEEAPPADDAAPDDLGGDLGGGDAGGLGGGAPEGGGADPAAPAAAITNTPRINLVDFARSVARLVNNYNALLDPKSTILNRAEAYIKSNYDERTAKELMQMLETNYSLKPTEMEQATSTPEEFPQPYMAGAWGGGAGGAA